MWKYNAKIIFRQMVSGFIKRGLIIYMAKSLEFGILIGKITL